MGKYSTHDPETGPPDPPTVTLHCSECGEEYIMDGQEFCTECGGEMTDQPDEYYEIEGK